MCFAAVKIELTVYYPRYKTFFIIYRDYVWKDK